MSTVASSSKQMLSATLRRRPLPIASRPLPPRYIHSDAPKPSASSSHLTPSEQEAKKLEEASAKPPPHLQRALGVKEPPKTGQISREEWRLNLLSKERRLKERKHLCVTSAGSPCQNAEIVSAPASQSQGSVERLLSRLQRATASRRKVMACTENAHQRRSELSKTFDGVSKAIVLGRR